MVTDVLLTYWTPVCDWCADPDVGERLTYRADPRRPTICRDCDETARRKVAELRRLLDAVSPGLLDVIAPETVGYWIGEGWSAPALARLLLGLPDLIDRAEIQSGV